MVYIPANDRISIQVSLSGYSFKVESQNPDKCFSSGWLTSDHIFTTRQFQRKYGEVRVSLLTPKVTLVPSVFFGPSKAREILSGVASIREEDSVDYISIPEFDSILVFSNSIDESLSTVISNTVYSDNGSRTIVLPEMYYLIKSLAECEDYNKIVASYSDSHLHLVVAQGKTLLLANVYDAPDFTTAEYFIFLAMKKLQLNPEMSAICFRTPLQDDEMMSLYRYFKTVEQI